jgi:hypothetical protein
MDRGDCSAGCLEIFLHLKPSLSAILSYSPEWTDEAPWRRMPCSSNQRSRKTLVRGSTPDNHALISAGSR